MKKLKLLENNDYTLRMDQGPGWSPDGGRFWVRGHFIYWEDGEVGDLRKGQAPCRAMPGGYKHDEDFSAWSDEYRAKVKKKHEEERAKWEEERRLWRIEHEKLVASARAKLTEDEYEAVLYEGSDW